MQARLFEGDGHPVRAQRGGGAASGGGHDRRRLPELWPFYAAAVLLTGLHLVFHVQPRYTLPARPVLFAFAAAALVWRPSGEPADPR